MAPEQKRRPRRTPLTPEEVADIIAVKKHRELVRLSKFKKSSVYKWMNLANILCNFVYFELLFCFMGPCNYQTHYVMRIEPRFGDVIQKDGKPIVAEIDVYGVDGKKYLMIVEEFLKVPSTVKKFSIGKDFLLGKDLKGQLEFSKNSYRLFSASPVIFLCLLLLVISSFGYFYNLNENAHSLMALTIVNSVTFLGILTL